MSIRASFVRASFALAAGVLGGCQLAENYTDADGPRYSGAYAAELEDPSSLPLVKLVTFNVKFGEEYEKAAEELATHPELAPTDVVLLQEMDAKSTDAIAARLSMNYVYYPGSVHTNGKDFGPAVLSRWPIVEDEKLILPHRNPLDGRIRIAVSATLATPLGELRAYSTHTEVPWLGPRARLEQAAAIVEHARETTLPIVAGGDFNTSDPGALDATVGLFTSAGYTWASRGAGDTAGGFMLDHLFCRGLQVSSTGTVESSASDHRPEWALVEFPFVR
jgi:endonuclease/exonuclease/phosphatase (EEP) superfamily protein YafD